MIVDIGEVKRHIKPKADSTLYNMRKSDLIEYVRTLEHNYNVGATFLENQAKYIESLDMVEVVRCKDCINGIYDEANNIYKCVKSADYDPEYDDWLGFVSYHNADYYCADGERRTDAN